MLFRSDAKNESFNDANKAYEKAKEILRKHPDIKGFQGGAAIDVLGIGRAIEEAGLQGGKFRVYLREYYTIGRYLHYTHFGYYHIHFVRCGQWQRTPLQNFWFTLGGMLHSKYYFLGSHEQVHSPAQIGRAHV